MSDITYQLNVYASVFSSEPAEVRHIPEGAILSEWLADNVKGFNPESTDVSYSQALDLPVHCDIDCYIVPQGGVVKGITKIFKKAVSLVGRIFGIKKPKMPNIKNTQIAQGDELSLASSNTQSNRYGEPIREAFGRVKVVPDYLVPPRYYFKNKREHWMEALLCVGVGDYEIPSASILVSNSPIAGLGGDNYARSFAPNANLSSETTARWWHSSVEVGPTSTGGSGLPLLPSTSATRVAPTGNYLFSGKTITPTSGQKLPDSWESGMYLDISAFGSYGVDGSVLTGTFSGLQVQSGDRVNVTGWVTGSYSVQSFTPATSSDDGTPSVWTAQSTPSLDYSTEPARFIIRADDTSATIKLSNDYADEQGLIDAINGQIATSQLAGVVVVSSGLIITELPNYAARNISVESIEGAVRVFGSITESNLTAVIGEPKVQSSPAKLELNGFNYSASTVRLSITKDGENFVITGATPTLLTIDRVDDIGSSDWLGWQPSFTAGNDSSIQLDANTIDGGWAGTFSATPADELADMLEFDVFFPQGLVKYNDDGKPQSNKASITFRYRESSSDGWMYFKKTYTETEKDQIGFTERITLPRAMRIKECQLKRDSAESTEQNDSNKIEWFGLRSRMVKTKTRYPELSTIAVKISGDASSAESDAQVSAVVTRKLNGQPTRSIKDAVEYIAKNTDVNSGAMGALDSIWQERGDYFDFQFNKATTVAAATRIALSVGFAELTIKDGLLSAVRDAKRPPELLHAYNHTYSAQNTTDNIVVSVEMPDPDEIDGYDVEYIDERTWKVETVRCQLPNSIGRRIAKITADGITNKNRAYRWGMRQLMDELLDNKTISTKTELDALNSQFGDYVNFVQEVQGWSQSALVASYSGSTITSTELLDWGTGQHVVALRRNDGSMSEVKSATRVDDYTLSVSEPFEAEITPHETHLFFGTKQRFANPAIVRDIRPSGDSATISATAYNANKYQYDDAEAPQ